MPSDSFEVHKAYARGLHHLGHGMPLWKPEPPESGEVRICDVGYLKNGGFRRIFNASQDGDNGSVPDGHLPYVLSPRLLQIRPNVLPPGYLFSRDIVHMSSHLFTNVFRSEGSEGAMLFLPEAATKELIAPTKSMAHYMGTNYQNWLHFARSQSNLELSPEDLVFVRGFSKTVGWSVTAYEQLDRSGPITSFQVPSARLLLSETSKVQHRNGPRLTSNANGIHPSDFTRPYPYRDLGWAQSGDTIVAPGRNQCIFLNYYKIKVRPGSQVPEVIEAGAGPHEIPRSRDGGDDDDPDPSSVTGSDDTAVNSCFPLTHILDYILKYSRAKVAIAHDEDIAYVCNGEPWPDNFLRLLEDVGPAVTVDPYGSG
ncbi:hypothetical protein OBBRIDRAFT_792064 [Obba rivulosa]|uniref:Uncharacterized protein n=1 Tax=Obba rivulosa TaxID=1052685 RepID=A0A8E2DNV1_9APHY|nr:hypothetical protein OBBRIDRAFT_792064 [Obba rivulosa]